MNPSWRKRGVIVMSAMILLLLLACVLDVDDVWSVCECFWQRNSFLKCYLMKLLQQFFHMMPFVFHLFESLSNFDFGYLLFWEG